MKQKIVVKVVLNDEKARSKALKIVVGISGVESAVLGGHDMNQIEIVGDGVDIVQLVTLVKKKIGYTEILSVNAVVGEKIKEEKIGEEKKDDQEEAKVQQSG